MQYEVYNVLSGEVVCHANTQGLANQAAAWFGAGHAVRQANLVARDTAFATFNVPRPTRHFRLRSTIERLSA